MLSDQQKGYLCVLGGFLTHLVHGAFYLWGNISINVSSYFRSNGYPHLETRTVSAVFPSIYIGLVLGSFLGVPLARKYGHKRISLINMIIYCSSMWLATWCNFIGFVIFMGFVPGFCIGIEYLIPVDNCMHYFHHRKGQMSGTMLCGLGFGSLIFNQVLQSLANPDNQSPINGYYSKQVADLVPGALRTLSSYYMIIGIIGVALMQESVHFQPTQYQKKGKIQIATWQEAFLHKEVYINFFMIFTLTGFGFCIVSHYKEYGIQFINDDHFFSIIGALGGLSNGLSRFFWSYLADHYEHSRLIAVNCISVIFLSATLAVIPSIFYLPWIVLIYFQYGGVYTIYPYICNEQFGSFFGPYVFNIAFTALPFANILQFVLIREYQQAFLSGQLFYLYSLFGFIAFSIQWYIIKQSIENKDQELKLLQ